MRTMRVASPLSAALLVALVSASHANKIDSGIEVDGKVGAYRTTKVAGCDDGVKVGKSLCYTWRLGKRPVVFIFAKTPSDALASLASEIDKVAAENADAKMAGVINFTGEPSDAYLEQIRQFGEELDLKHVALTTTNDAAKFKVNEEADVTVMHYKGKKVAYSFGTKELTEDSIKEVVENTSKILE